MGLAQIKMPQLGESVTEGTVDKWLKREGDMVKRDEPLVEVVTDKVNAEIPSPFEGKLVKISATEGETVRVGAVIAQIEVQDAAGAASQAAAKPSREAGVAHTEVPPEPAGVRDGGVGIGRVASGVACIHPFDSVFVQRLTSCRAQRSALASSASVGRAL